MSSSHAIRALAAATENLLSRSMNTSLIEEVYSPTSTLDAHAYYVCGYQGPRRELQLWHSCYMLELDNHTLATLATKLRVSNAKLTLIRLTRHLSHADRTFLPFRPRSSVLRHDVSGPALPIVAIVAKSSSTRLSMMASATIAVIRDWHKGLWSCFSNKTSPLSWVDELQKSYEEIFRGPEMLRLLCPTTSVAAFRS